MNVDFEVEIEDVRMAQRLVEMSVDFGVVIIVSMLADVVVLAVPDLDSIRVALERLLHCLPSSRHIQHARPKYTCTESSTCLLGSEHHGTQREH